MAVNWFEWPSVPKEQRPKKLYHNQKIGEEELEYLEKNGWQPVDVRLLPSDSDADRANALKAYFLGLRLGTVKLQQSVARYVEVEARVLGLTSGKGPPKEDEKKNKYEDMEFRDLMEQIGGKTGHPEDKKHTKKENRK